MKLFDEQKPWYKANLHTHTTRSDGKADPEDAIRIFREHGYSVLAITDHRRSWIGREEKDFILLSGAEMDTGYIRDGMKECYHVVGIGMPENEEYKTVPRDLPAQEVIDFIREKNALAILAHPAWSLNSPDRIAHLQGITAAEMYNTASGFPYGVDRPDSSVILDTAAALGQLLPLVASDDCHHYNGDECRSFTMIQPEEFTTEGILNALKSGRFYASRGPRIHQVELTETEMIIQCSECIGAVFYTQQPWAGHRASPAPEGATEFIYKRTPGASFLRAEVIDRDGNKAWISPIAVQ